MSVKYNFKTKRNSPESDMQIAFFKWLEYQYPEIRKVTTATGHGGSRHLLEAIKLKKEGLTAGFPDIACYMPKSGYAGFFMEMKSKNGRLTETQKNKIDLLVKNGYKVVVAYSFEEAVKVFMNYVEEKC